MTYNSVTARKFWRKWKKVFMVAMGALMFGSWAVTFAFSESNVYAAQNFHAGLVDSDDHFEVEISDVTGEGDYLTFTVKYRFHGADFPSTADTVGVALHYFGSVSAEEYSLLYFDSRDAEEAYSVLRDCGDWLEVKSVRKLYILELADTVNREDEYTCRLTVDLTYYDEANYCEGKSTFDFEFKVAAQ